MKKLLIGFLSLFASFSLFAQPSTLLANQSVTNGGVQLLFSGQYLVEDMSFNNTNATGVTLKFYDWATAATNVVRAAYSYYTNIATTATQVYTNSAGLTATNTYPVLISTNVTVAAVTNEQTKLRTYYVPASTESTLENLPQTARGLVLLSTGSGFITVQYRGVR